MESPKLPTQPCKCLVTRNRLHISAVNFRGTALDLEQPGSLDLKCILAFGVGVERLNQR